MSHEFLFDVKLFAAIRVTAASEAEARQKLAGALDCADTNFGAWPDGTPILAEASMDGDADLQEVDGEDPDDFLIAAAPDLYDLAARIEAMLTRQGWRDDGNDPEAELLRDTRAAIDKAEGRS